MVAKKIGFGLVVGVALAMANPTEVAAGGSRGGSRAGKRTVKRARRILKKRPRRSDKSARLAFRIDLGAQRRSTTRDRLHRFVSKDPAAQAVIRSVQNKVSYYKGSETMSKQAVKVMNLGTHDSKPWALYLTAHGQLCAGEVLPQGDGNPRAFVHSIGQPLFIKSEDVARFGLTRKNVQRAIHQVAKDLVKTGSIEVTALQTYPSSHVR